MAINDAANGYDVTVLMPVYNGADFVEAAIQSILMQQNVKFKLIVFNDGSTDSTLEILAKYHCKDVQVIDSVKNIGYVHALNQMLPMVSSPYIARLDADDVAHPQRLAKQITYIESRPSTLVLATDFEYIDTHGRVLDFPTDRCLGLRPSSALLFENVLCHPTVLLRTSVFSSVTSEYDANVMPAEDYDLWLKCAEVGDVEIYPEKLTQYRLHAKQITGLREKSTYKTNSIIRIRHLERTESLSVRTNGLGIIERIKSVVQHESEKHSFNQMTTQRLMMRYLLDFCISGELSTRKQAVSFLRSVLIDETLSLTEKLTLIRFARKSLLS